MSIKTLSPYYVSVPLTNPITGVVCSSYTMNIYVWNGSKSAAPAEPTYTMTKINAAGASGIDKVNIARIASDFIEFGCIPQSTTVIVDGENQVWVRYECFYDDAPDIPGLYAVELATKGYGYFLEGENPQLPANKILLTGDEFKVNRNGRFVLPFMVEEPEPPAGVIEVVSFTKKLGLLYELEVTADFAYTDVYVFVRAVGDTDWIPCTKSGPLYAVPADVAAGLFEVMAAALHPVSGEMIYSEPYTIIPLKINKIEVASGTGGHGITVFFTSNIAATTYVLQIYGLSGPTWSNTTSGSSSPLPLSITPTGSFKARISSNGLFSNEVPFDIELLADIIIP